MFRKVLPSELTSAEVNVLSTLRSLEDPASDMTLTVKQLRENPKSMDKAVRIILAEAGGDIVGWSVVEVYTTQRDNQYCLLNTYVREDFREQGIGRELTLRANAAYPEVSSMPPDFRALALQARILNEPRPGEDFYRRVLPQYFDGV